jgi:Domain of unknown function (DUF4150)
MAVFANSMEISSKSMGGKSICQFPDVCFTPPLTPATPPGLPIPYPNTGMSSDTSDGSTSVKISGEQIMLKDKSVFKQSTGDEAGSAPMKGMINSKIKGKVYFLAWSMDVKVEGENVVRNLDMTTHNHGSPANGVVPTVHIATVSPGFINTDSCSKDKKKVKEKCGDKEQSPCPGVLSRPKKGDGGLWGEVQKKVTHMAVDVAKMAGLIKKDVKPTTNAADIATAEANSNDCVKAMRCVLRPYKPTDPNKGCCPGQTGHHIPPKSMLEGKVNGYKMENALCVCLEGTSQHVGSHGESHAAIDYVAKKEGVATGSCSLKKYNSVCATAVAEQCGCEKKCIEDQLNASFEGKLDTPVNHWDSKSNQLSPALKDRLNKVYDAKSKVSKSK